MATTDDAAIHHTSQTDHPKAKEVQYVGETAEGKRERERERVASEVHVSFVPKHSNSCLL